MSKYKKKVLEIVPEEAEVFELTKEKVNSLREEAYDTASFGILNLFSAFKSLKNLKEANFLVVNKNEGKLVTIDKHLHVQSENVTTALQSTKNRRYFIYNGNKYTLMRKIKE